MEIDDIPPEELAELKRQESAKAAEGASQSRPEFGPKVGLPRRGMPKYTCGVCKRQFNKPGNKRIGSFILD